MPVLDFKTANLPAIIEEVIHDLTSPKLTAKDHPNRILRITTHNKSTPTDYSPALWNYYASPDALVLCSKGIGGGDGEGIVNPEGRKYRIYPYASIANIETARPYTEIEQGQLEEKIIRIARTSR